MTTEHIELTSNWQPRELKCWYDLPVDERENFAYVISRSPSFTSLDFEASTPRFVKYKDEWYDVNDTEGSPPRVLMDSLSKSMDKYYWSYQSDSFFSGLMFGVDGPNLIDEVIVVRYIVVRS